MAYPHVDIEENLHVVDRMAALVGRRLAALDPGYERAVSFMEIFNIELGFRGNREDYYNADNSFLNVVLDRRTGLPILLSLICAAIGRRLHLQIDGVGLPSHFMARLHDEEGDWLLDPFNGHLVTLAGASDYLAQVLGQPVALPAEVFRPVTPAAWAQRILNNLRNVYLGTENYAMAAQVADFMIAITPTNPPLWRECALFNFHAGRYEPALRSLNRYFFLRGQFSLLAGPPDARDRLLTMLSSQDRELYLLYRRLQDGLSRIN
jgi:regulator of sirC expression with transglutaminase-like and TPR domain